MVFAPMQTGADGLRHGWGRRVTDRFSPQPHAPFPLILVWGVLRGGRRGADGDSRIPAAQPGEPRVGEVPLRSGGQRKAEVPAGCAGCQAQGWKPRGCPPQRTSLHLALNRRPHLRRHFFHRFLRLSPASVFRFGVLFLPSLPSSVHFPSLACSSFARSLPHSLQPRHSTE